MLRGRDVHDIRELKRQGLSIRAISRLTGYCRKTIRRYLGQADGLPVYGPRDHNPGQLDHSRRPVVCMDNRGIPLLMLLAGS